MVTYLLSIRFFNYIGDFIENSIKDLSVALEEASNLPTYIMTLALALLGIFIPLATATLMEVYRKKDSSEKGEFSELDFQVILDSVFRIKLVIFYTMLVFVPLLCWNILSSAFCRLLELIFSFLGIIGLLKIFFNTYRWLKGDVLEYRLSHLRKLKNLEELDIAWGSVWKNKNLNIQIELRFFKIFSITIDKLLENPTENGLITVSKLLEDFYKFANNRSRDFLYIYGREEVFPGILKWHFEIWKMNEEYPRKPDENRVPDFWIHMPRILKILDNIIKYAAMNATKSDRTFGMLVDNLKKHLNKHRKMYSYIEQLIQVFYEEILESASDKVSILLQFPDEWKVTKRNIENKDNIEIRTMSKILCNWISSRMSNTNKNFDLKLENIAYHMFPETDPNSWAVILIFALAFPSDCKVDRVKLVVERKWPLGYYFSRATICSVPKENIEEVLATQKSAQIKNTYELAILLFSDVFTQELLQSYIEEAEKLKFTENPENEQKRLRLLEIFRGLLNVLSQKA